MWENAATMIDGKATCVIRQWKFCRYLIALLIMNQTTLMESITSVKPSSRCVLKIARFAERRFESPLRSLKRTVDSAADAVVTIVIMIVRKTLKSIVMDAAVTIITTINQNVNIRLNVC